MERSTVNAKLVMLGETAVGKSCLVMRFCKGEFPDWQDPTIGAAFMTHVVRLTGEDGEAADGGAARPDGAPDAVKFEIWDTAGQERYRSLAPMYYRGAAAACVVYDITNRESFDGAQSWIQELQGVNSTSNVVMALVGSKKDLAVRSREVPEEDAEAYAAENGLFFMETSAKTGENVQELFREVAVRLPALARPDAGVTRLDGVAGASNAAGGCCGG